MRAALFVAQIELVVIQFDSPTRSAPGGILAGVDPAPGKEGTMWRRVSCEQLLDTSQSLLRLRGNPIKLCGVFSLTRPQLWPKGNEVLIPQPDSGTDSALVPTRQREMSLRRPPELWEELSFLHNTFYPLGPYIGCLIYDSFLGLFKCFPLVRGIS